jgi:hypothetical protein
VSDPNSAINVVPTTPQTGPAGDNRERIIIIQDVSGDRDVDDPNPPPVWHAVPISAATYRDMLKTQLKPRVVDSVPDPEDPEVAIAITAVLDTPTAEWPLQLCEQVPELRTEKNKLAALDQLEALLLQRAAFDGELVRAAKLLLGVK